jgi:hypothetical protein
VIRWAFRGSNPTSGNSAVQVRRIKTTLAKVARGFESSPSAQEEQVRDVERSVHSPDRGGVRDQKFPRLAERCRIGQGRQVAVALKVRISIVHGDAPQR